MDFIDSILAAPSQNVFSDFSLSVSNVEFRFFSYRDICNINLTANVEGNIYCNKMLGQEKVVSSNARFFCYIKKIGIRSYFIVIFILRKAKSFKSVYIFAVFEIGYVRYFSFIHLIIKMKSHELK